MRKFSDQTKLGKFLIEQEISINQLARVAGLARSTISRHINRLGYLSYPSYLKVVRGLNLLGCQISFWQIAEDPFTGGEIL